MCPQLGSCRSASSSLVPTRRSTPPMARAQIFVSAPKMRSKNTRTSANTASTSAKRAHSSARARKRPRQSEGGDGTSEGSAWVFLLSKVRRNARAAARRPRAWGSRAPCRGRRCSAGSSSGPRRSALLARHLLHCAVTLRELGTDSGTCVAHVAYSLGLAFVASESGEPRGPCAPALEQRRAWARTPRLAGIRRHDSRT